jgi:hypothetical protein
LCGDGSDTALGERSTGWAYASWPVAVLHTVGTGTDVKSWWMLLLTAVCVAAVLIAVFARVGRSAGVTEGVRFAAGALSLATVAGLAVFTLAGPLRAGWARKAGTPANLLGVHGAAASRSTPSATASLSGTVTQQAAAGGAIVQLSMRLGGGAAGQMRVRLGGQPLPTGGLSLTGSQVALTAPGMPSAMVGRIVSLQGNQFAARVSDASGSVIDLRASLTIDQNTGAVKGTMTSRPVAGR